MGRKWRSGTLWFVGLAVIAAPDYLVWLGWHRHKHLNSAGTLSGPYETWQVLGVVAVLAGVSVFAARRGHWFATTASVPVAVTTMFSIEAATNVDGDGLWPVGALLVLLLSGLGTWLVAYAARPRQRDFAPLYANQARS